MRISVNENYFRGGPNGFWRGQLEAIRLLKDNGFDTVDIGMHSMEKAEDENDHNSWINQRREFCDKMGVTVNQAHAPFCEGRPISDLFVSRLIQCVDDCSVLGAKCLVVHGDTWFKSDYTQWNYNEVVDTVYNVYAPVVERAEKLGVKIAFETLFEWLGNNEHRVRLCSYVEEIDDLIAKFKTDSVGVCWDFGHAYMAYGDDQFKAMKRLRSQIIATHVHDNTRRYDNHNIPYQGYINWDEGLKTLAEIGYNGDLTFELNYGALPPTIAPDYIKYLHSVGKYMKSIYEINLV